jgi:hypothetical protein
VLRFRLMRGLPPVLGVVAMTATLDTTVITQPGVYDLPADVYHADPVPAELGGSLSSSGAKLLLPPSCPAIYQWARTHPTHSDAFDFGHGAHAEVLGVGAEIVVVDADDWRSKAAQEAKKAAHAAGKTPLLAKEAAVVKAMAVKLREHPVAAALLDPDHGKPEQSLFAQDEESGGVWLRAMLDWLPIPGPRRTIIPDYKTTSDVGDPEAFGRTMANFRYHGQAAWYLDMLRTLDLADDDAAFVFIVQSKQAPYLVSVLEPDAEALEIGRAENRAAINLFAKCTSNNDWPGYDEGVVPASLPGWYTPRLPRTI